MHVRFASECSAELALRADGGALPAPVAELCLGEI
jgi:polyribonucleotide nucleotidyltransferase